MLQTTGLEGLGNKLKKQQIIAGNLIETAGRGWMPSIPIRVGGKIVRRVVVIDDETRVRERTFYEFDQPRDWKRKLKEVLA